MSNTAEIESRYDGPEYGPETEPEDAKKYSVQMMLVHGLMMDGEWRSSLEICNKLAFAPTTRVDSRLRDLRKRKYGRWNVECRRCEDGVYRYRINGVIKDSE